MVDDFAKTLQGRWETIAAGGDTLAGDPGDTLRPPTRAADTGDRRVIAALADGAVASEGRIELGDTLGEGGMGVVHLARQASLDRMVAVKALRAGHQDEARTLKLLQEAWITGRLEHPNVVPVHDIALGPDGAPLIVLKRIEGEPWSALMRDAERVRELFGAEDLLEWNLRVLMQVCNATHFAHTKGVLHLDIKPDNVMLGAFGEVYLLDWGIAMAMHDDGGGRLPLARDNEGVIGTPYYLAPEMLGGLQLSEATDGYLLGASLHEVLVGRPPHRGETLAEILHDAFLGDPPALADAPEELAQVCRRALSRDPRERFEDAESLRKALASFLQHRGSTRLADEARERLVELDTELARVERASVDPEDRQRLYSLFGAIRFGFQEALESWGENDAARHGLTRATTAMIRHELAEGDVRAASALAGELAEVPAQLRDELESALAAHADDQVRIARLEQFGRQNDPGVGQRTRAFLAVVLGFFWVLVPLYGEYLRRDGVEESTERLQGLTLTFLFVAIALGVWARDSLSKTSINRRFAATVLFLLAGQLPLTAGAGLMGLNAVQALTLALFFWFTVGALVTIMLERRFWPVPTALLIGFFLCIEWPDGRYIIISATTFVFMLTTGIIWKPEKLMGELAERAPGERLPPL